MKIIFSLFFLFPFIIPYANARQKCNQSLSDIFNKVSPSVVFISSFEIDLHKYSEQLMQLLTQAIQARLC